jgi:hypothetical protein
VFPSHTFANLGARQNEPFKPKRLILRRQEDLYEVTVWAGDLENDPRTRTGVAHGLYDFAVVVGQPGICWVRREYSDRYEKYGDRKSKPGAERGHTSISRGQRVYLAGTLLFGGGPHTKPSLRGKLITWENRSGHYRCGNGLLGAPLLKIMEEQTRYLRAFDGTLLLPMDKFQEWDGDI